MTHTNPFCFLQLNCFFSFWQLATFVILAVNNKYMFVFSCICAFAFPFLWNNSLFIFIKKIDVIKEKSRSNGFYAPWFFLISHKWLNVVPLRWRDQMINRNNVSLWENVMENALLLNIWAIFTENYDFMTKINKLNGKCLNSQLCIF